MSKIITTQLAKGLYKEHALLKNYIVNPQNFTEIYKTLISLPKKEIKIFDITHSLNIENKKLIEIKDHINHTGSNILIGNQKSLNIDFLDLTNIYTFNEGAQITTCVGGRFPTANNFSSPFLCNISIIARAMKFEHIYGYLYNHID